jgi:hypothetical protein
MEHRTKDGVPGSRFEVFGERDEVLEPDEATAFIRRDGEYVWISKNRFRRKRDVDPDL